jgi:hypothetical protein
MFDYFVLSSTMTRHCSQNVMLNTTMITGNLMIMNGSSMKSSNTDGIEKSLNSMYAGLLETPPGNPLNTVTSYKLLMST